MNLTNQVLPSKENFIDFMKNYPSQTPLVMVNIIKYKDKLEDGRTGEEAYNTYNALTAPLFEKVGGKLIWAGNTTKTIIGDLEDTPDRFLIAWYPSKEAFIALNNMEAYKAIAHHRHLSLEYGGLIAAETLDTTVLK